MFARMPSPQNPHVPDEPAPKPAPKRDREAQRIFDWRVEMFRDLGFNELQAESLAERGVDWHYVKDLVDHGCPLAEALDIAV